MLYLLFSRHIHFALQVPASPYSFIRMVHSLAPLDQLKKLLTEKKLDAFIVDHDDPHSSEVPHPTFGRIEFISGFTGSLARALITHEYCYLWTDSRYFLQAELQLKSPWKLMKYLVRGEPTLTDFLSDSPHLKIIGYDPYTTQYRDFKELIKRLPDKQFVALPDNPLDSLWLNRPEFPQGIAKLHPLKYCGETLDEKVSKVRDDMTERGVDALALTMLDEIAYLLNLRGSDTESAPFLYSYLVVEKECLTLFFINDNKLDDEVRSYLKSFNVVVKGYNDIFKYLEEIGLPKNSAKCYTYKLWVSPCASTFICNSFLAKNSDNSPRELLIEETPVSLRKAVKNEVEINSMKKVHITDSIALCRLFAKLESMKDDGSLFKETEHSVAEMCKTIRADEGATLSSFEPISSIGPNCAIVHYKPTADNCNLIAPQIYLLDSGAQFEGGTTDVTRVLHFGVPSDEEKECYTLTLKGLLALRNLVFPEGTTGYSVDVLARQFLWKTGRNYYHGTGHGLGMYLNVHEGPVYISTNRFIDYKFVMEPGVVLTNEPGYYKRDSFGVRIENAMYVKNVDDPTFSKDDKRYYEFADLTFVPYCKELIDVKLLTQEERDSINDYHKRVATTLLPLLDNNEKYASAIKYIKKSAEPI